MLNSFTNFVRTVSSLHATWLLELVKQPCACELTVSPNPLFA